jgi:hypothetical protein
MPAVTKPQRPIDARLVPALDLLQRYSIPEANALLRQSNAKTWTQIKTGELRTIRDGGRVYIPGSEIVRRSTLPATDTATG